MMTRFAGAVLSLGVVLGLAACGPSILDPVPAPVSVMIDELEGQTVDVPLDSVLNINVGDADVTAFTAIIDDPSIAAFQAGEDDGSAQFNPGVRPLAVGETAVTLTDETGKLDPIEFVLRVTE